MCDVVRARRKMAVAPITAQRYTYNAVYVLAKREQVRQEHAHCMLDRRIQEQKRQEQRQDTLQQMQHDQIVVARQMLLCLLVIVGSIMLKPTKARECPWHASYFSFLSGQQWFCLLFDFYQSLSQLGIGAVLISTYSTTSYLCGSMMALWICTALLFYQTWTLYYWRLLYLTPPFAASFIWSLVLRLQAKRALARDVSLEWNVEGLRHIVLEAGMPCTMIAFTYGCVVQFLQS